MPQRRFDRRQGRLFRKRDSHFPAAEYFQRRCGRSHPHHGPGVYDDVVAGDGGSSEELIAHSCVWINARDVTRQSGTVGLYMGKGCCGRWKLPIITFFSMLGEIETLNFMMLRHTKPH